MKVMEKGKFALIQKASILMKTLRNYSMGYLQKKKPKRLRNLSFSVLVFY